MKRNLLFIPLVIALFSCVDEEVNKRYITHIHTELEIKNIETPQSKVYLQKRSSTMDMIVVDTLDFNPSGEISFNLKDSVAHYYRLIHQDFYLDLFLSPRDSLRISFDNDDMMTSLKFKGERGKQQNRYLAAKRFFMQKYVTDSLFALEPEAFSKELVHIRKEYMFALNEANLKNQDFRKSERRAIDYIMAKLELIYPAYYEKFHGAPLLLPNGYYDFVSDYQSEDPILLTIPEYVDFFSSYILLKAFTLNENPDYSKESLDKEIDLVFKHEEFRNFFKNFLKI